MPTITIGSAKTYATPQIAWDTLAGSDQGGDVIAEMDAEDYPIFNPTTDSVNKWTFKDALTVYDFTATTEDSLARINRVSIGAAVSNFLTLEDLSIYSSNAFQTPFICAADNNQFNRVIIQQTATNNPSVSNSAGIVNTNYDHCVILGGADVVRSGFGQGATKTNCVIANGNDKGVEASGGVGVNIADKCFSVNNGGSDYDTGQMTITQSASEDLTGTYTGYDDTEFVDFAGRNYLLDSGSALATIASGSYVGVGVDAASGITITGATTSLLYSAVASSIDLTGEISVQGITTTASYQAINSAIELTPTISIEGQTTSLSYSAVDGSLSLSGLISISAETTAVSYEAINSDISLQGTINLEGSTTGYAYNALNGTIILKGPITINPKNVIRVKRVNNTVRVGRKSNTIIVR